MSPNEIQPVNEITDREQYEYLVRDFQENGYDGRPVVVYETPYGYQALTGSHRVAAAREADIDVPAAVIRDSDVIERLSEAYDDWSRAEEAKLLFEEGMIDETTRDLLTREEELNQENYGVPYAERKRFKLASPVEESGDLAGMEKTMRNALRTVEKQGANKNTATEGGGNGDVKYKLVGKNKYGIEVYETSEQVKKLTWAERKKQFLDLMNNQYRGRTAKFIRNGHAYYASFEASDINKNIYGDRRSDASGKDAKIKAGADGDVFTLVENAKYNGSKAESGKNIKAHQGVAYWDYFLKKVQIDGTVFDLLVNVRKKAGGQYVYSLQLNEDKNESCSAPSLYCFQ